VEKVTYIRAKGLEFEQLIVDAAADKIAQPT
jgi:hypothetical protein